MLFIPSCCRRFVPNVRWLSGRHLPSACLTLQSAPLHCPAGSTVTDLTRPCHSHSKRGELLAVLVKGQVHLYHGGSGIKVGTPSSRHFVQHNPCFYSHTFIFASTSTTPPFLQLPFAGCKGISHGTSLLPLQHHSHQLFAVGSRCGRFVLFDADLLQQQELVTLPSVQGTDGEKAVATKDSAKTSANALFKKAAAGTFRKSPSYYIQMTGLCSFSYVFHLSFQLLLVSAPPRHTHTQLEQALP